MRHRPIIKNVSRARLSASLVICCDGTLSRLMLTGFGTFWAGEGIGLQWPGEDLAILGLIAFYAIMSGIIIYLLRQRSVCAGSLTVDLWRNVYTQNFNTISGPSGRTEPSVSEWIPSTPAQ